jgi:hypothetical protein
MCTCDNNSFQFDEITPRRREPRGARHGVAHPLSERRAKIMSLSGFFGDICSAFFREKGASNDPAGGICTFDCLLLFDVSQLIMTF